MNIRKKAINLRKHGFTYGEIPKKLGLIIPKSTMTFWFKNIVLNDKQQNRIKKINTHNLKLARKQALVSIKAKRLKEEIKLKNKYKNFFNQFTSHEIYLLSLVLLYLCEGTKGKRWVLTFGNSDPVIIKLFLKLFRKSFKLDEKKFRCTVQCRNDQNLTKLNNFWSQTTKIPLSNFYKPRIDPRSIGKKTKKCNYKGVCRIDYLSSEVYREILFLCNLISKF